MSNNWIFLRGLTRGNIHWGDFPTLFLEANPTAQIEYLELPGNGSLSQEKSTTDVYELINILKNKSKIAQSGETYNICGISLGGMVALKWTELYPELIESVTVINSSLSQYSSFYERLRPGNYFKILMTLVLKDTYQQEKNILTITSNHLYQTEKFLKSYADFAQLHKVSIANFIKQLFLAKNIKIKKINCRKFNIVSSVNDRLVHKSCSEKIAKNLEGKLIIHRKAGHDLPLDTPQWLIDVLLNK